MLFEHVARRLINIEEHEYSLVSHTQPNKASCQSRFNTPEIISVLGRRSQVQPPRNSWKP